MKLGEICDSILDSDCYILNGEVYGPKGIKKLTANAAGYLCFSARNLLKNKRVTLLYHRALWESIHGRIPKEFIINHLDGNKSSRDISNLELTTYQGNFNHSRDILGNNYTPDKIHSDERYLTCLTFYPFWSYGQLERHFNLPRNSLRQSLTQYQCYPIKLTIRCVYPNPRFRLRGKCTSYWYNYEGSQITIDKEIYDKMRCKIGL